VNYFILLFTNKPYRGL